MRFFVFLITWTSIHSVQCKSLAVAIYRPNFFRRSLWNGESNIFQIRCLNFSIALTTQIFQLFLFSWFGSTSRIFGSVNFWYFFSFSVTYIIHIYADLFWCIFYGSISRIWICVDGKKIRENIKNWNFIVWNSWKKSQLQKFEGKTRLLVKYNVGHISRGCPKPSKFVNVYYSMHSFNSHIFAKITYTWNIQFGFACLHSECKRQEYVPVSSRLFQMYIVCDISSFWFVKDFLPVWR